jgi:hypothetical protein
MANMVAQCLVCQRDLQVTRLSCKNVTGTSYPTVRNRLNDILAKLDQADAVSRSTGTPSSTRSTKAR